VSAAVATFRRVDDRHLAISGHIQGEEPSGTRGNASAAATASGHVNNGQGDVHVNGNSSCLEAMSLIFGRG
jgi:hypothetical protein